MDITNIIGIPRSIIKSVAIFIDTIIKFVPAVVLKGKITQLTTAYITIDSTRIIPLIIIPVNSFSMPFFLSDSAARFTLSSLAIIFSISLLSLSHSTLKTSLSTPYFSTFLSNCFRALIYSSFIFTLLETRITI